MSYEQKLNALVDRANSMHGTAGNRALCKVIGDLEGDGPIGEILHSIDPKLFAQVIDLLVTFRKEEPHNFNDLHHDAQRRLGLIEED